MVPSRLFALIAVLSSLVAVNGAVIERDGTFTFLTPQPTSTAPGQAASTTTSVTSTPSSTSTTTMSVSKIPSSTVTLPASSPTSTTSATVTQPTCPVASVTQCPSTVTVTVTAPSSTCPPGKQVNCNGVVAWQRNLAYTAGNRVTFNGHLWTAVQWTFSNTPGDASGTWEDQGPCA